MHSGLAANVLALAGVSAKVLIADDSRLQRKLLQEILEEAGHTVVLAQDGVEAVAQFQAEQPDLVLMDIKMPNLEGIEAAREIQKISGAQYIPIIFVTQASSRRYLQECIEVEGDDFIAKPVDPIMLTAKIRSILRVKNLYQQQYDKQQKLLVYQQQVEREQQVAASLYETIIKTGFIESPNLRFLHSAMSLFNGDVLLSAKTPSGQHYILLGDFTGHGLSASIGVGPTAEVFYGMTKKGFRIQEIIIEINRKLFKLLPVDIFFAACLVSLDASSKTLSVFTGGLPDHYLYNTKTRVVRTITSSNLPLGIVNSDQLRPSVKYFDVSTDDKFYCFTDGVIETENRDGAQFGQLSVLDCLYSDEVPGRCGFDTIKDTLTEYREGLAQQDDITLAELSCDSEYIASESAQGKPVDETLNPTQWKLSMEFHAATLKEIDPVPIIVQALMEIQRFQVHRDPIFIIVSELFSGALEYGLLGMDPKMRLSDEQAAKYFELRENRLQALKEGAIKVSVTHKPNELGGRLTIRIQDTGVNGWLRAAISAQEGKTENTDQPLGLLNKICQSIDLLDDGNHVKAVYQWIAS